MRSWDASYRAFLTLYFFSYSMNLAKQRLRVCPWCWWVMNHWVTHRQCPKCWTKKKKFITKLPEEIFDTDQSMNRFQKLQEINDKAIDTLYSLATKDWVYLPHVISLGWLPWWLRWIRKWVGLWKLKFDAPDLILSAQSKLMIPRPDFFWYINQYWDLRNKRNQWWWKKQWWTASRTEYVSDEDMAILKRLISWMRTQEFLENDDLMDFVFDHQEEIERITPFINTYWKRRAPISKVSTFLYKLKPIYERYTNS